MQPPWWRLELLGGFHVHGHGQTISQFRTHQAGALLAYLVYHAGHAYTRDHLIATLWPGDEEDSARHKLSVALSWLRQKLEIVGVPDGAVFGADRYSVHVRAAALVTDVAEFESLIAAATQAKTPDSALVSLTQAVELYQGPLLPGHFEDWIVAEQRRLEGLLQQALGQLVELFCSGGHAAAAVPYALRAVAADPLSAAARLRLIRLFLALGQECQARRQYDEFKSALWDEFGTVPSPEFDNLFSKLDGWDTAPASPLPPLGEESQANSPESVGGALPPGSTLYVARGCDQQLEDAVRRRVSIVVVSGARESGKTSLMARGLQRARATGIRVAQCDLQSLNEAQMESAQTLLATLSRLLCDSLELPLDLKAMWDPEDGPNINFGRIVRRVIQSDPETPLLWGLDNVDRLFHSQFGTEIFALVRSWHNERALNPGGPWPRLTLILASSVEGHLFITDPNLSPFNVGVRINLPDLDRTQVGLLNQIRGAPLRGDEELDRFIAVVGGHPYLVQRGLQSLAAGDCSLSDLELHGAAEDGLYGDHLRRIRRLLTRNPELLWTAREFLDGRQQIAVSHFRRLHDAGLFLGDTVSSARPRCELYLRYLLFLFGDPAFGPPDSTGG